MTRCLKLTWSRRGSNPGPSACKADVIPLHHNPAETCQSTVTRPFCRISREFSKTNSAAGTRTRVSWVRAMHPNQLDYGGDRESRSFLFLNPNKILSFIQCVKKPCDILMCTATVWPSGLRRCVKAAVRKGVGSNPTAVMFWSKRVTAFTFPLHRRPTYHTRIFSRLHATTFHRIGEKIH